MIPVLLVALSVAPPASAAEMRTEIRIGGTGGAMKAISLLADEFRKSHPGIDFKVIYTLGTSGGLRALGAGGLDLSISSRPLKNSERSQGLREMEYARTPFVFAVSKKSRVSEITFAQLVDIYSGRLMKWPDGAPIRVVMRPASDTDTDELKKMSAEMKKAVEGALSREGSIMAIRDDEAVDALEKIAGSIGPSTLGIILSEQRQLKALTLDGAKPTVENIAQGRYPYFKQRFLITRGVPSAPVQAFISFINSEKGRKILSQTGHWVVKDTLK
ncbi:MAG TPA: substrate-binding domain-containing protein [Dissulfurispiraceae bacterium]